MDTSIECSNNECKHFDYRVAVGLLEEPEFNISKMRLGYKDNSDWFWFRNAEGSNLPSLNHSCRIGEPHGNNVYDKEKLHKYGMVGLYAKKGSGVKKCGYVNSFGCAAYGKNCPILHKIDNKGTNP